MGKRKRLLDWPKRLSVLVPTLHSRMGDLASVLSELERQIGDREDIEVLALLDMRTRTLGDKRNMLMSLAKGEYLTFINDDDAISPTWLDDITKTLDANPFVDVVSVGAECYYRNGQGWELAHKMVTTLQAPFGLTAQCGELPKYIIHKPCMWCVWRSDLARSVPFPDITYAEDTAWMHSVCRLARREVVLQKPVYRYYADDDTSEAGIWKAVHGAPIRTTRFKSTKDILEFFPELKPILFSETGDLWVTQSSM